MGSTAGQADDLSCGIGCSRIHGDFRPQLARERELLLDHVQRGDMETHGMSILNSDVAKPTDAGDGNPFAWAGFGFLDALVGSDPGTQDRRHRCKINVLGKASHVCRIADSVLCEGTIDAVPAVVLKLAQRFPARDAVLTCTARIV